MSPGVLAGRVVNELARWPGLRVCRAECGRGAALALGPRQIVHLPGDHEAELRLGAPAVRRLGPALNDSRQLIALSMTEPAACPDDPHAAHAAHVEIGDGADPEEWVRIRMDGDADVSLILSLASIAIAAGTGKIVGLDRAEPSCPRARRVAILGTPGESRYRRT
ncbi:hypothetical protein ETD83_39175 [Actinomadura soli]|uniref:Uncharacterized protein n=1 Tax=Actinomadura soli TaxID=2508997 RepID=A0A5C4J0M5_9ACTN|nr:luciferase family protein [Actinomadura soli]TMQ89171.1 hypothetical protein ETD83_39175 [Actinomadura soli]